MIFIFFVKSALKMQEIAFHHFRNPKISHPVYYSPIIEQFKGLGPN